MIAIKKTESKEALYIGIDTNIIEIVQHLRVLDQYASEFDRLFREDIEIIPERKTRLCIDAAWQGSGKTTILKETAKHALFSHCVVADGDAMDMLVFAITKVGAADLLDVHHNRTIGEIVNVILSASPKDVTDAILFMRKEDVHYIGGFASSKMRSIVELVFPSIFRHLTLYTTFSFMPTPDHVWFLKPTFESRKKCLATRVKRSTELFPDIDWATRHNLNINKKEYESKIFDKLRFLCRYYRVQAIEYVMRTDPKTNKADLQYLQNLVDTNLIYVD